MREQPQESAAPLPLPLVDATEGGDFYALGDDQSARFLVWSKNDPETDQPYSPGINDAARFDPRCLRFHDLKKTTPQGRPDKRFSVQIYNDPDAEYEPRPKDGESPFKQPDEFTARNRSTREMDGSGRVAIPCSQRWVVDSEDGKHVLAIKFSELGLSTGSAPQPLDPTDDAGGGLPPGVVIAPDGSSVSIVASGGAVTFRGGGAVAAAQDAARRGGTAGDVARAASNAARGLPPPPDGVWEGPGETRVRSTEGGPGGPGGTRVRPPAPTTSIRGGVVQSTRPDGYVTDGKRHGLWKTLITLDGNEKKFYFRGGEGTPIGRTAIRSDAHFSLGGGRSGALRIVDNDASQLTRGPKLFKGELWPDASLANQDTEVGFEDFKLVCVVGVDASIPPSTPPPVIGGPGVDGGSGGGPKKGGSGPLGGGGSGGPPGDPGDPGAQQAGGTPRLVGRAPGTTVIPGTPFPPVQAPESQTRDFTQPGVPCPNLTSGRALNPRDQAVNEKVPGVVVNAHGQTIDTTGYAALTPLAGGGLAVGGFEGLPPDAIVGDVSSNGFNLGLPPDAPHAAGRGHRGGFDFVPAPPDDPASQAARRRAAAEATARAEADRIQKLGDDAARLSEQSQQAARDGRNATARDLAHRATTARRQRQELQHRQQQREAREQARDRYANHQQDVQRERVARARELNARQHAELERQRLAREERHRSRTATGIQGAYVIPTGDAPQMVGQVGGRFGDWNVANAELPLFGAPGGAQVVETHLHLLTAKVNAQTKLLTGLLGGPGFFAGNIGQREQNRPGKPPAGSDIGQEIVARCGETVVLPPGSTTLRITSKVDTTECGTVVQPPPDDPHTVCRISATQTGTKIAGAPPNLLGLEQGNTGAAYINAIDKQGQTAFRVADGLAMASEGFKVGADGHYSTDDDGAPVFVGTDGTETPLTGGGGGSLPDPVTIAHGGTGATTAAAARTALGLSIGADVQAYDAELAALAGLTSAADKLPYFTGAGAAAAADFTAAGRALVDDADAAAQRTTLGLGTMATQSANAVAVTGGTVQGATLSALGAAIAVADGGTGATTAAAARTALGLAIGSDVQAYDPQLTSLAALSFAGNAGKAIAVNTGETDFELVTIATTFGGNGSDGAVTQGAGSYTDLSGPKYYTTVTLSGDATISATAGTTLVIYLTGNLTLNDTSAIHVDGRGDAGATGGAGSSGAANTAVTDGTAGTAASVNAWGTASATGGGGGGGGGGRDGLNSGGGGAGGNGVIRSAPPDGSGSGAGGAGGAARTSDGNGNNGTAGTAVTNVSSTLRAAMEADDLAMAWATFQSGAPGSGGGGGAGGASGSGGTATTGGAGGTGASQSGASIGTGANGTAGEAANPATNRWASAGSGGGQGGAAGGKGRLEVRGTITMAVGARISANGGKGGNGAAGPGSSGSTAEAGGAGGGGGAGASGGIFVVTYGAAAGSYSAQVTASGGAGGTGGGHATTGILAGFRGGDGANGAAGETGYVSYRKAA